MFYLLRWQSSPSPFQGRQVGQKQKRFTRKTAHNIFCELLGDTFPTLTYHDNDPSTLFAPNAKHVFAYICAKKPYGRNEKTWLFPIITLEKGSTPGQIQIGLNMWLQKNYWISQLCGILKLLNITIVWYISTYIFVMVIVSDSWSCFYWYRKKHKNGCYCNDKP